MKKMNKKIAAFMLTVALCSSIPLYVSAAPETAAETVTETSVSQTSDTQQSSENSETSNYRFSENTVGNADLIASEEVVADNGQFQFIAVTTRDGDIFYVIIDRMKAENNVYFLNEVDTYDLQKLMGNDDNSQSGSTSNNSQTVQSSTANEVKETSVSEQQSSNSTFGLDMNMLLIGGLVILAVIAFIIFKMKKGGFGKKKQSIPIDDDFEYEEEINEDEENKS